MSKIFISKVEVKEAYMVAMLMSSFDQMIDVLWRELNERLEAAVFGSSEITGEHKTLRKLATPGED